MAISKKQWILAATKKRTPISEATRQQINDAFVEMIDTFKKKCIKTNPDKSSSYLVDIYSSWYRNYFYLCEKYKAEFKNRTANEFERKFVRLEYIDTDCFNFSYFRHTGQWHLVAQNLSLEDCKSRIMDNPVFQPLSI